MFDRLDCETIKVLIASFGICKLYGGAKVQKPIALLYCNGTCNVAPLEERKLLSCENISICRKRILLVPPLAIFLSLVKSRVTGQVDNNPNFGKVPQ